MLGTDIAEVWICFVVLFFVWTFSCALSIDGEKPWAIGSGIGLLLTIALTIALVTGAIAAW